MLDTAKCVQSYEGHLKIISIVETYLKNKKMKRTTKRCVGIFSLFGADNCKD